MDPRLHYILGNARQDELVARAASRRREDWQTIAARVTSTRFVGRAEQLAELCSALDDAAASQPSLAFVSGESAPARRA